MFDSGDTFVPSFTLEVKQRPDVLATAQFIVDQYSASGLAAMTLGDRDLLLGASALKALAKRAKFPILAANLVGKSDQKLIFPASAVVEAAGLKVGVIGVMGTNARISADGLFTLVDATKAVGTAIAELKGKSVDMIVVLSHLTDPEQVKLAKAYPSINAILGGGTVKMSRQVEREGTTFITNGYSKGKQLALLRFNIHEGKTPVGFVDRYQNQALSSKVTELQGRIERYQKIVERQKKQPAKPPAAGAAKRPSPASRQSFYVKQITKLRADKQLAEMQLADAPKADATANFVKFELVPLAKSIVHEPAIEKAVLEFRKKVPKLDAKAKRAGPSSMLRPPPTIPARMKGKPPGR